MFWTNRLAKSSVRGGDDDEFEDGVSLHVDDLAVFDYFNINNSLVDGKLLGSIDATVSYNMRWAGHGTHITVDDGSNFRVEGRQTTATIEWSARESGFRFHSDPASTTHTNFALVGEERNGVFYSKDD